MFSKTGQFRPLLFARSLFLKLSATILPDHHRDFLRARALPGSGKHHTGASVANDFVIACFMVLIIGCLVVIFGAVIFRAEAADLFSDTRIVAIVVLGVFMVPFGLWWLRVSRRMRRKIREQAKQEFLDASALRLGINIGEAEFEFGEDDVIVSLELVQERYSWDAFCALEETAESLLLVIDSGSSLIVPKRATDGDASLHDLKSLVDSHIGAKA